MSYRSYKRVFIKSDTEQKWRYRAVRVTKYDPAFRNEQGHYMRDEWTSISDIGRAYNGDFFTRKEYLQVETAYIDAVKLFMNLLKSRSLLAYDVNKCFMEGDFRSSGNRLLYGAYLRLNEHSIIAGEEIDKAVKLALRELLQCSFLVDKATESYIHFGYDYYMYFVSNVDVRVLTDDIRKLGLYLE